MIRNKMQQNSKEYKYVSLSNGEKIHYREQNQSSTDDEAILLVHGNFSSLGWWNQTIEGLRDTHKKLIAYDQRGFGRSTYINKCDRFEHWAKDGIQIMDLLHIKKAILIGWSFGGAICQKIAQLAPNRISKLILTCSVADSGLAFTDKEGKPYKSTEQIVKIPRIQAALGILESKNKQAMRNIFDLMLYGKLPNLSEQRKSQMACDPFYQRCYPELLTALANTDIDATLIKTPTLMIHGTEDLVIPVQTILSTATKLGKLDLWEGGSHMIPLEDTNRYIESVKKFI